MVHRLPDNFPQLLREAGLTVVEIPGWQRRSAPGSTNAVGNLNHHIGASAKGWSLARERQYAEWMFLQGRSDLPPPLCNTAIGRSGVVYIGAAGRANHAGTAKAVGSVAAGNGNTLYFGTEWMLSGTEEIPAVMIDAGIKLNAVITEKVTKTSVKTIASHWQTSVTGKWDIGDPNGIRYKDKRVLDVEKFREAVEAERDELYRSPILPTGPGSIVVKVGHFSGQFSDNPRQWAHDLERVMSRDFDWITGTEAGEMDNWTEVKKAAKAHGYLVRRHLSNWIAIKKSIRKKGSLRVGRKTVIPTAQVVGPGHDTSYLWATFTHRTPGVGKISVVASHYPTRGYPSGAPAQRVNLGAVKKIAAAVSTRAASLGKGAALAFYGGDQNVHDKRHDTFFGGPLVSSWDELRKWPSTGHGPIDVIARLIRDKRVECVGGRVFTDRQLFLHSDHFLVQAKYRITLRK